MGLGLFLERDREKKKSSSLEKKDLLAAATI
jgi:hypothetical protein